MKRGIFIFQLLIVLMMVRSTSARVYLDISQPEGKRLPIAVQDIHPADPGAATHAREISMVIRKDLEDSGIFNLIPPSLYPPERSLLDISVGRIDFKVWRETGADLLFRGVASIKGGRTFVRGGLFDTTTGRELLASSYEAEPALARSVGHRISDDIIYALTGRRGSFGSRIAYVSTSTGNKEIYVMDRDGNGPEAVTRNGSINISPSWSPDGKKISYVSFKDGRPAVYIKELTAGTETRLTFKGGTLLGTSWAPDGKRLALVISNNGNSDIYTVNSDGTSLARITDSWGLDVSPSWSGDGSEIAFVSDRGGSPQIYVMDSNGKNIRRVTFEGKYNVSPSWSPAGNSIIYAGMDNGGSEIFMIGSDGTGMRQLTSNSGMNESPSWSPDGRFIAFSSTREGISAIYVMSADGSGQVRISPPKENCSNPRWGHAQDQSFQ